MSMEAGHIRDRGCSGVRYRRPYTSLFSARLRFLLALLTVFSQPVLSAANSEEVWTAWSEWSECSFSCGRGVRSRYRECVGHTDNGLVRLSRPSCPGRDRQFVICQNPACEPGSDDEREAQCSEHNTDTILNTLYHWVPFYGGPNPCELTCLARGYSFYYNFGHVKDGTPCKKNGEDLCVGGHCASVGCDDHVGSNAEVDDCGVCGGQNTNCAFFRRTYAVPLPPKGNIGYVEVVKIPSGSTQLKVTDTSNNYLALADSRMTYIINGNWVIDWPGRYEMAGTTIYYGRSGSDNETITADGPIKEDLHLTLIFRERNPGVSYQFWLPGHKLDEIQIGESLIPNPEPLDPSRLTSTKGRSSGGNKNEEGNQRPQRNSYGFEDTERKSCSNISPSPRPDSNRTPKSQKLLPTDRPGYGSGRNYGKDAHYAYPRAEAPVARETGESRVRTPKPEVDEPVSLTQAWWEAVKRRKLKDASSGREVSPQLDDVHSAKRHSDDINVPYRHSPPTLPTLAPTTPRPRPPFKLSSKVRTRNRDRSGKSRKSNEISPKKDSCPPCRKVKNRSKHFCASDFVIRAKILGREQLGQATNDTRYDVKVLTKYRDVISLLSREYIWVPNRCHCPRLHSNREYVVMGTLVTDSLTREGRLQLDRNSFVRAYNKVNEKRMGNLQRSLSCTDKNG